MFRPSVGRMQTIDQREFTSRPPAARGFSLIELMVVLFVIMIGAAIAIPTAVTMMRSIRLSTSSASYANLLQQARIRAVKDDNYYSVISVPAAGSAPAQAFVDIAGTGVYAAGDPVMIFGQGVSARPYASGPGLANLQAQFLPAGAGSIATINTTAAGPTFGPRGLPCTPVVAAGYTTCPFLTPTSFVTFLQNNQGGAWSAITLTPAGRVREWRYDGANWSPLN
jgi:prepilin-type N-terminal cleavage/methylation domain-containing protein